MIYSEDYDELSESQYDHDVGSVMTDETIRIQSLARGLAMVSEIAESDGDLTAAELSRRVGVSRQTAYHLLHTLRQTGYVEQGPGRRYRLGWAIPPIVGGYQRQLSPPVAVAHLLQKLRDSTLETCCLSTWSGDDVVVIDQKAGDYSVRVADIPVGQRGALHARASSKILLARADPEKRARIVAGLSLEKFTTHTIVRRSQLQREIDDAASAGYAMDDQELALGLTCLAACFDYEGTDYALTILAPTERLKDNQKRYLAALMDTTDFRGNAPRNQKTSSGSTSLSS